MAKHPGDEPNPSQTPDLPQESPFSPELPPEEEWDDPSFLDIMAEYQYTDVTRTDVTNRSLLSALLETQVVQGVLEEDAPTGGEPEEQPDPLSSDSQNAYLSESFSEPEKTEPDIIEQIAQSMSAAKETNVFLSDSDNDEDTLDLSPLRPPSVHTEDISLGATGSFDQMFAPKHTYVGDDDPEDWAQASDDENSTPSFFGSLFRSGRQKRQEPVLTVEEACEQAQKLSLSLRLRSWVAFVVLLPLVYISVAQSYGFLPTFLRYAENPFVVLLVLVFLQILVMLCALDVLGKGAADLLRLRPGVETMTLLSCVASLLHVFTIVEPFSLFDELPAIAFLPYCAVSGAAVFFALRGSYHRRKAQLKTYKAAAAAETPDVIVAEQNAWNGEPGFSRQNFPVGDFTTLTEQSDLVTKINRFITPLLIVLCFVLAALSSAQHNDAVYFFWAFSALCCAAVPLTAFGAFSAVYSRIASRLAHMGASITGWPAAVKLAHPHQMITQDTDLFPPGSLNLTGLRVFSPYSFDQVVSFSSSLLSVSGSGLYGALAAATYDQSVKLYPVQSFQAFEGGFSAEIDGKHIHLGTLNFMHSMAIRIPSEHSIKNAVYVTVNLAVAGIFPVSYTPSVQVEDALLLLEQQKIQSVLAVRDFNITPNMLKEKYGINPDLLEFPVVEDRFTLSDKERDTIGRPAGVLTRDGLCSYAEAIVGGKRLHRYTIINLVIHMIALIFGLLVTFYFTHQTAPGAALAISPQNLIGFMLIWWLIQWVVSFFSHRY